MLTAHTTMSSKALDIPQLLSRTHPSLPGIKTISRKDIPYPPEGCTSECQSSFHRRCPARHPHTQHRAGVKPSRAWALFPRCSWPWTMARLPPPSPLLSTAAACPQPLTMAAGSRIAANHTHLSELPVKQRFATSGASLRMHMSQRSPTRILRREVQSLMGEVQEEPGSGWEPARASCRDWGAPTAMARRCSQPSLPWSSSQQGKGVTWHQLPLLHKDVTWLFILSPHEVRLSGGGDPG